MPNQISPQMQLPEPDHEGRMAKSELYRAAKMSIKLFQMIQDGQELEGWVQAKITKSADYLDSIYHYMEYQMKFGQGGQAASVADIAGDMDMTATSAPKEEDDEEIKVKESYEQRLNALLEGAMKKTKKVKEDPNEGNEFSGALAKAKAAGAKEFKVGGKTHQVKEASDKKFDPLKHVKNPTKGEKDAAKDVKRGSYADRAAMLKSAEKDGRLKEAAKPDFLDMDKDGDKKEPMKKAVADKGDAKPAAKKGMSAKQAKFFGKKDESIAEVAGAQKCWPGHRKVGTQAGTGKNKGKRVNDCEKIGEGFPTVADAKARAEKEKTTGKFDKKQTSTGTQYTRKANTFTDGGDDKDTKVAKKKAKAKTESSATRGQRIAEAAIRK